MFLEFGSLQGYLGLMEGCSEFLEEILGDLAWFPHFQVSLMDSARL